MVYKIELRKSGEWVWDSKLEKDMSDFGCEYTGCYMVKSGVLYVGVVTVKPEFRGTGKFHTLMELLKERSNSVVLILPTDVTRHTAEVHGFKYDSESHAMLFGWGD